MIRGKEMKKKLQITNLEEFKKKTAILILAYADYESLELALATHAKFSVDSGVHIYILQNGRGTYDCERTYAVGQKYHYLFPDKIDVVDYIPQDVPYKSIKRLFHHEKFKSYDYIIKLDDDVMVLTPDWVDKLCQTFIDKKKENGDDLAYVSSLVNNNPWGFKKIIEYNSDFAEEYFSKMARKHIIGSWEGDPWVPYGIAEKDYIHGGGNGTVWRNPNVARWIHQKTTFNPTDYIRRSENLPVEEVQSKERYSINCMLFEKDFWDDIDDGGTDDEHMCQAYCLINNKKIFANMSIPMVHLCFFVQRNEIRDMIDDIRNIYTEFLNLNFPISMCSNRLIEIENRLRFMENQQRASVHLVGPQRKGPIRFIKGGIQCIRDHGLKYTLHYIPKRLKQI